MHNNVSIEATMAMVSPTIQTFGLVIPEKSGVTMICLNSSIDEGTGKETKCSLAMANELPDEMKSSFNITPRITAISAPGINFNFLKKGTLSQAIRMVKEMAAITIDPNCMWFRMLNKEENEFTPSV